jgi:hypothetical protein
MGIPVKIFMIAFQFKTSHNSEHIDPPWDYSCSKQIRITAQIKQVRLM